MWDYLQTPSHCRHWDKSILSVIASGVLDKLSHLYRPLHATHLTLTFDNKCPNMFSASDLDLWTWPSIHAKPGSRSAPGLNIKVIGQTLKARECTQMDRRRDEWALPVHYLLVSRSIMSNIKGDLDRENSLTVTPKSGEVELHIAPRLAAPNIASIASTQFGK